MLPAIGRGAVGCFATDSPVASEWLGMPCVDVAVHRRRQSRGLMFLLHLVVVDFDLLEEPPQLLDTRALTRIVMHATQQHFM